MKKPLHQVYALYSVINESVKKKTLWSKNASDLTKLNLSLVSVLEAFLKKQNELRNEKDEAKKWELTQELNAMAIAPVEVPERKGFEITETFENNITAEDLEMFEIVYKD